jgi:hypothetical protein
MIKKFQEIESEIQLFQIVLSPVVLEGLYSSISKSLL